MSKSSAKLKKVEVNFGTSLLGVKGSWEADESEIQAAWELYVELCTRITVAKLQPGEGLLREALTSHYNLFNITREILRKHGPSVATPKGKKKDLCFAFLAVSLLNTVIRPVLAKYHPLLQDHEAHKHANCSACEHEQKWEHYQELREKLEEVRKVAIGFANLLAEVAGVKSLIIE